MLVSFSGGYGFGGAAGAKKAKRAGTTCVLVLLFILPFAPALSAQNISIPNEKLLLLANPRDEGIELRWAPGQPEGWPVGLTNGYTLSRELAGRNGVLFKQPGQTLARTVLLQDARPQPELSWKPLGDTSDFALALAAMIYGQEDAPDLPEVLAQQHGIALFAADHDFPAAVHGALGYLDVNVRPGEIYRYTVSNGKDEAERIIARDARIIPKVPVPVSPEISTKSVILAWNRAKTDGYYSSYNVERSDNGGRTFFRLNKLPLVQILNDTNYDALPG